MTNKANSQNWIDAECLFQCLQDYLPIVAAALSRSGFPSHIVTEAIEQAEFIAINAIYSGLAARMCSHARRQWLRVVARNNAVTITRKRHAGPLPESELSAPESMNPIKSGQCEAILKAVEGLPRDLQAIVECVFFFGLSGLATCRRLGISRRAFETKYTTAILELLAILRASETEI